MIITYMPLKTSHGEKISWIVISIAGAIWVIMSMSVQSSTGLFFSKFVTGAIICNDDFGSGNAVDNQIRDDFDSVSVD